MESNSLPKGIVHVVVPHHNHNFDVCMIHLLHSRFLFLPHRR